MHMHGLSRSNPQLQFPWWIEHVLVFWDAWTARKLLTKHYRFLGNSPNRVAPPAPGNCPAHQFSGITLHHCDHKSHLAGPLPCHFCSHESLMYSSPSEMTFLLHLNNVLRASLAAQWLRVCLLMQGTRVRALVWEDPTCRGAAGPVSHNYWACVSGACAPQQERPQ